MGESGGGSGDSTAVRGVIPEVRLLPKGELHLHLLAAMRPATLAELASDAGREAPDPRGFRTFDEFQEVYAAAFEATSEKPANLSRVVG
ncbi:adenosine deaminase [Actinacidiphila yanglinensis]|uniref:Adenosine deaminase n=1 Tax=Actinacidiphila yanglinensis TaxID=310779 RepID=A0A1H6CTG4_9ACTN|nr:hypothetical protein [Actinacidiphila yanglinensis]SEG76290.1 adenosine deaminase [Actinacidiphila yanglinensis]